MCMAQIIGFVMDQFCWMTPQIRGEDYTTKHGSIRGLEVVDDIKAAVDKAFKRPVVSCADILLLVILFSL